MSKPPLFLITGASGSGKTKVITDLILECPEHIVLDLDALFVGPLDDWDDIRNIWIHVANQMTLNHRLTILCGTFMPSDYDKIDLKDQFSPYYIGLHCNDHIREERLKARGWDDQMIKNHKEFNDWIMSNADHAFGLKMPLYDTGLLSPKEVAIKIKSFIETII